MRATLQLVSCLCLVAAINAAAYCPDYWTAYQNKCYRLFFDQYEWGTAENVCVGQGGHLASPSTSGEHNFINNYILGGYTFVVWLGGNDIAGENNWQWTDKSEWKFTAWHTGRGEPDGGNAQDCLMLNYHKDRLWSDDFCYNKYRFICETPDML